MGKHRDLRSSYPSSLRDHNNLYQVSRFEEVEDPTIEDFINDNKTISFGIVYFKNIRLKNPNFGFPYISTDRMLQGALSDLDYISDNGRVLKCSGEFTLVITDVDLELITRIYDAEKIDINLCLTAEAAPLPKWEADFIDEYFKKKSDYKNIVKDLEKAMAPEDDIFDANNDLTKVKNMFNAIYGLHAQDPCKAMLIRDEESDDIEEEEIDISEEIDEYYGFRHNRFQKSSRGFLPYSVGVWCTAYSRRKIFSEIFIVCPPSGSNSAGRGLYVDTDSLFYMDNEATEELYKIDNQRCYDEAIKNGDYITDNRGKIINYNSFDEEDEFIRFKFLHSKCYAYEQKTQEGEKLKVTVAGVAARKLKGMKDGKPEYIYKEEEVKTLERFNDHFTFRECGSTKSGYIKEELQTVNIDGHVVECGNACIITPTQKTIKDFGLKQKVYQFEKMNTGRA